MAITNTTFRGLVFDIMIEEFNDRDGRGHLNAYVASLYLQYKTTSVRHLVRRSRLPGAADAMKCEIERDGIRAFRRLALA